MRLSNHFLLSDFMGCNSVYAKGYPNTFYDNEPRKVAEGRAFCTRVLEPLLAFSRISISYGYISPALSRLIVKYQDPDKPSYHRWDLGAACDVVLHDRLLENEPPVFSAFWIDENLPVSRVITYSESPFICVASRKSELESGDYRRALYENRYVGERKPKYISYSDNPDTRRRQKSAVALDHPWEGGGYPSYHGGGVCQAHHIRTSTYTMLSDFLYSTEAVTNGFANLPPSDEQMIDKFRQAGAFYDSLIDRIGIPRLSIVRAYESPDWATGRHTWEGNIYLVVIPPVGTDAEYVMECALAVDDVSEARVIRGSRVGIKLEA